MSCYPSLSMFHSEWLSTINSCFCADKKRFINFKGSVSGYPDSLKSLAKLNSARRNFQFWKLKWCCAMRWNHIVCTEITLKTKSLSLTKCPLRRSIALTENKKIQQQVRDILVQPSLSDHSREGRHVTAEYLSDNLYPSRQWKKTFSPTEYVSSPVKFFVWGMIGAVPQLPAVTK